MLCCSSEVTLSHSDHIQIVRGLLMGGLSLGMLGFVLSLLGMECTYIGGKDKEKNRTLLAGGVCHLTSGKYSNKVVLEQGILECVL